MTLVSRVSFLSIYILLSNRTSEPKPDHETKPNTPPKHHLLVELGVKIFGVNLVKSVKGGF